MTDPRPQRYVSPADAAEQLAISYDTVIAWCMSGKLTGATRLTRKCIRIPQSAIDRLVAVGRRRLIGG